MPAITRFLLFSACFLVAFSLQARGQGFFVSPDRLMFVALVGGKDIDTLMLFSDEGVDIGMDHDIQGADRRYFQTNKPRFFQMQTSNGRYPIEITFSCEQNRAFDATLHVTDYITHFYVQLEGRSSTFSEVGAGKHERSFAFDAKQKVLRVPDHLKLAPLKVADLLGRIVYTAESREEIIPLQTLARGTYFVVAANERFKFIVSD